MSSQKESRHASHIIVIVIIIIIIFIIIVVIIIIVVVIIIVVIIVFVIPTGMVLSVSPRILSSLSSRSNLYVSPAGNFISTALTKA